MTLYETIFTRRSVRQYNMMPLDGTVLADLRAFLDATKPLDAPAGRSPRFEIVGAQKVKKAIAPHYILAFCAANSGAYANVGYVLQNADLYLQSKGYGCCWQGMAKPNEPDDDYCILLAFGKTNVPPRQSIGEFKRLQLDEICDAAGMAGAAGADLAVAEAARLAPSAVNSQPWKLEFSSGKIIIRYFGRGMLRHMLKKKMSKIDLGIVTRHVVIALENAGKAIQSVTPLTGDKEPVIEVVYK